MSERCHSINYHKTVSCKYEADVVIIGGGIAGVSAACSAAMAGASVILMERMAVTGGNATSGGVGAFCGETSGQGEVFDQIVSRLERFNAIAPYAPYGEREARIFDHEILAVVLQEILLDRKIKLLLHTRFVDAVLTENGRIDACIICGNSGIEAVRGRQFIDCSGEAVLAHAAGFETMKGRTHDGVQLPMSMMFFVRHIRKMNERAEVPDGIFEKMENSDDLPMVSVWPNGEGSSAIKIKIPLGDSTNTESITESEIRARQKMMSVLKYYQKVEGRKWMLDHASPLIGIREGRRVVGEYILTVEDLRAGRKFDDAIARGVFYLDGHSPDDDKRTYILPLDQMKVPPYQIPLRCLMVKNAHNLMVAGRCMSADQLALSSARVMTTCSMMGQAAGIAAVLAVKKDCAIRDLDYAEIRKAVCGLGAELAV